MFLVLALVNKGIFSLNYLIKTMKHILHMILNLVYLLKIWDILKIHGITHYGEYLVLVMNNLIIVIQ
ncbi:MAG: hypothetical protein CMI60_23965 [Parvibaculum sp.]|nr:hypothetical protein [Parvibaculum sp.]